MKKDQKLIIIIGPPASGKMSVGSHLAEMTGFKLFHNHQSIDPVLSVFGFDTEQFSRLVYEFRTRIFEEVTKSDIKGIIFTFVWAFNRESGKECLDHWTKLFKDVGAEVYMAELQANLEERKKRNKGESRYIHKSSKRDIIKSEEILLKNEREWEMTAPEGFTFHDGFVSIENSNLSAFEVAKQIKDEFKL